MKCIICENSSHKPFYEGLLKCKMCGHVFADISITDKELRELYRKNYFFGEEYNDYIADSNILRKNFRLRKNSLSQFVDKDTHKNLLEIGCAYGFFLDEVKNQFIKVKGIDISEDAINYAKNKLKLDVTQTEFLDFQSEMSFDVVCMWDTIEHLKEPQMYIDKLSKITPTGGLLAITTGDIGSLMARIRRKNWRMIHPPTHLHYFTKKTLKQLFEKYGYEIIHMEYCGFYRSFDFTLYNILVLRSQLEWLYNLIKERGFDFNYYFNSFDILYLIGMKK